MGFDDMAKVLGLLVFVMLLVMGVKFALAALHFAATAVAVGTLAIFGIGMFMVSRFFLARKK